jgi:hypothetical protein
VATAHFQKSTSASSSARKMHIKFLTIPYILCGYIRMQEGAEGSSIIGGNKCERQFHVRG